MVLTESQLLFFKATYGPKICTCTVDVKQIMGLLTGMLWTKTHESRGSFPHRPQQLAEIGLLDSVLHISVCKHVAYCLLIGHLGF